MKRYGTKNERYNDICDCVSQGFTVKSCLEKYDVSQQSFYRWVRKDERNAEKFAEAKRQSMQIATDDLQLKARTRIAEILDRKHVKKTVKKGKIRDGKFVVERVVKTKRTFIPQAHLLIKAAGLDDVSARLADGTMPISQKRKIQASLRADLLKFIEYFWDVLEPGREFIVEPHIKYICSVVNDNVARILRGGTRNWDWIVVNVPPSSSKSTIFSVMMPVWLWCRDPSFRILTASHSSALSNRFSKRSRELIRSDKFQILFGETFQFIKSGDSVKEQITSDNGMRITSSVGASITGGHFDFVILDDLHDAQSEASKPEINRSNAFLKAAASRETDPQLTLKFLIGQRIAVGDVTDTVLNMADENPELKVLHVCLPAKNEYPVSPESARNIYDAETGLLAPIRIGEDVLKKKKTELGTLKFVGQYMQQPAELGGNVFKRDWFKVVDESLLPDAVKKRAMEFVVDTAYEEKDSSDPTAIMAFKQYKGDLYVFKCVSQRIDSAELPESIKTFVKENGGDARSIVRIENKASGKTIVQLLRKFTKLNVKEFKVTKSKEARARAISAPVEAGKCFLVKGGWIEDFLLEVTAFPRGAHDDMVDCLSMAGLKTWLKGSGGYSGATG